MRIIVINISIYFDSYTIFNWFQIEFTAHDAIQILTIHQLCSLQVKHNRSK